MRRKPLSQPPAGAVASATRASDYSRLTAQVDTSDPLALLVRRFQAHNRPVTVNFRKLLPALNCADRLTHLIHPYPAKLLVHIPFFFLCTDLLSKPGDLVLDPFCGSGTVLLESQFAARAAIGADANPLARFIARVKTTPLDTTVLPQALDRLVAQLRPNPTRPLPDVINAEHWFLPHVLDQLQCLREAIDDIQCTKLRDFFLVCFSTCVRKVSLADPRLSVPVRLQMGQYPIGHPLRRKTDSHLRELRDVCVADVFRRITRLNITRMARIAPHIASLQSAAVVCSDARTLRYDTSNSARASPIPSDSIQLIVTSPPYPGAQKYIRACSLSLGWLGLCAPHELRPFKLRMIGREEFNKTEYSALQKTNISDADQSLQRIYRLNPVRATIAATYLVEMRDAIVEMCRVLKPGGHLVLVAANNRIAGQEFRTASYLQTIAQQCGLVLTASMIDAIRSRGLMTKRNETASVISREWVLLFTKGALPTWSAK